MRRLLVALALGGCVSEPAPSTDDDDVTGLRDDDDSAPGSAAWFEDVTEEVGFGGLPTGGGCGVAVGDIDGDGLPDLYVTQLMAQTRLFRNLGNGTFANAGAAWGLGPGAAPNFGATFADLDGDGDADLVRMNLGVNEVLRNDGPEEGFVVVPGALGLEGQASNPSVSIAFADMDGDGDLDAYVTNGSLNEQETTEGTDDRLYRNDDGQFTDVSHVIPIENRQGFAFVAGWTDVDHDGDPDIYVVNDFGFIVSNQLFLNEGTGPDGDPVFTVATDDCGCAITEAGMGLAIGDADRDGWQDFYLSNGARSRQGVTIGEFLLKNDGGQGFIDVSLASGAVAADLPERQSSWGVEWVDVDNDGWLDAVVPFGAFELGEPDTLMMNQGDGTFRRASSEESGLGAMGWGMGVGVVDYDGDGCLDVVIANRWALGPRVYRNTCATGNHWLQVELRGAGANTEAVGGVAVVEVEGLPPLREEVFAGSTSAHSSRWKTMQFGLGAATLVQSLTITWPDGSVQVLSDLAVDQRLVVEQELP